MKEYSAKNIHNICFLGHGGSGKTSVVEAMLYLSNTIDRLGKTSDGTSVSDYDPEEIKRKISIQTSIASLEWNNNKINLLDTPGYFDFEGEMKSAMSVSDGAVIVLSSKSGLTVGAQRAIKHCNKINMPKVIFISKMDSKSADYYKVIDDLKQKFGALICPLEIPIIKDKNIIGYVNLADNKGREYTNNGGFKEIDIPDFMEEKIKPLKNILYEAIAQTDDELMDKFFADEPFTADEIAKALKIGVASGDIIPVLCGSAYTLCGISFLLDTTSNFFPASDSKKIATGLNKLNEQVELKISPEEKMSAFVFKTVADAFVGKMSYFRVITGMLKKDRVVCIANGDAQEKVGRIFNLLGKKQIEVDKISTGDIGVTTKLASVQTGDTLCDIDTQIIYPTIKFPNPTFSMAIKPLKKGDEEKISSSLHKLMEEDKTFTFTINVGTKQQIFTGFGDIHIDVILSKLKNKFKTEVEVEKPRVAYRETIKNKVQATGKHKKQSGGHGQYGHVVIEFEPNYESDEFIFEQKVYGGAVPKNYFPAVEKGLRDCMKHGIIAGYPVVGLKATLLDGSYHPVDSSELAFKIAASIAFKEGLSKAGCVILEPVGKLVVTADNDSTGDIIADINKRRGRILGMEPADDDMQIIEAEVPQAEMSDYCMSLRSITGGKGSFTFEFQRYEELPSMFNDKIIKESDKLGSNNN